MLMIIAAIGNMFFGLPVTEFIFNAFRDVVMLGLGAIGAELLQFGNIVSNQFSDQSGNGLIGKMD
jgi:hypothetical protein